MRIVCFVALSILVAATAPVFAQCRSGNGCAVDFGLAWWSLSRLHRHLWHAMRSMRGRTRRTPVLRRDGTHSGWQTRYPSAKQDRETGI